MLIKSKKPYDLPASQITDEGVYRQRRRFLKATAATAVGGAVGLGAMHQAGAWEWSDLLDWFSSGSPSPGAGEAAKPPADELTPYEDVTSYNNFYEFGTDKSDPKANAQSLRTRPWQVVVDGECDQPATVDIDDLLRWYPPEQRIYRLRCVETWSMVIPWNGFPLGPLLRRFAPNSRAKYVEFTTLLDPEQMPGQRRPILDWPYREGLRMDEAMHPLSFIATGLYDRTLPNQNGAPLRLVVPWKYGFKSIKSIVRIRFTETRPETSWNTQGPQEYGFYANVNPAVSHPRWSQARERRIGEFRKRPTLPFNGYGAEVASLYTGMDLSKYF